MNTNYEEYLIDPNDKEDDDNNSSSGKDGALEPNEGNLGPEDPYGYDEKDED